MFSDDIGKYRKDSKRVRLSSEIGAYRRPPYGLTRCTDDIAPFKSRRKHTKCTDDIAPFTGKSLSPFTWIWMGAASFGLSGLAALLLLLA